MAQVAIDGDELQIQVEGWEKLWTLRSHLTIPLDHVRGATVDPGVWRDRKGLKMVGTHLPGVIAAEHSAKTATGCSGTSTSPSKPWSSNSRTNASPDSSSESTIPTQPLPRSKQR